MPTISWWGHATLTIADGGVRVLTDPVLGQRLAHLRRRRGPVPDPAARDADVVVVSHLHRDHLDLASLALIDPRAPIVLPRGATAAVGGLRRLRGRQLIEVAPGEEVSVGGITLTAVAASHDGRRQPGARRAAPALGYLIAGRMRTYFAGDTVAYPGLPDAVSGCDLALLPVGGWGPGLGPGHLTPSAAAGLLPSLRARYAAPIHFGTFWPIGLDRIRPDEFLAPGATFRDRAALLAPGCEVRLLVPGQTIEL